MIFSELMSLDLIHSEKRVHEYLNFCKENMEEHTPGFTQLHHILPRGVFPEYEDLNVHKWNGVILSNDNHYIAHSLLYNAIEHFSFASAWYAMNNKNYFRNEPLELLGADLYNELIIKRNKQCSENAKGKVMCRSISNPKLGVFKVLKDEFDNNTDLVGHTAGMGGEHLRGTIPVIINGKTKRVTHEEFKNGDYSGHTVGKTTFKDKDGNKINCDVNDPRVISGELVGINKGRKFKNPLSKGQMIKINIFNNNNELVYECLGNFVKICKNNNLPIQQLRKTIKNNSVVPNKVLNKNKQYIGWYARKIK